MIIRILYTILLVLVCPIFLFGLYKKKPNKPKYGKRWQEHFGIVSKLKTKERPLWIHAVSVGEALVAISLIKRIKEDDPDVSILVTTTTSTGAEQIEKLGDIVEHRYMPIDFPLCINNFLKIVNPKKLIIIETELWLNTILAVSKKNIPIYLINARLSVHSKNSYRRFQYFFNLINKKIDCIICQSKNDFDNFLSLGIPKKNLYISGSIKYDITPSIEHINKGNKFKHSLGLERPIWVAASTHEGEDELILKAHQYILDMLPNALLIIVPRHPERFDSVFHLSQCQFKTQRRSREQVPSIDTQVYIADSMGEMYVLLSASNICFMAGSLLGKKVGGHNVLEPISINIPTITGPSNYNFKDIVDQLVNSYGIVICQTPNEIANEVIDILTNEKKRHELINNAQKVLNQNKGSIDKTVNMIIK